MKRQLPELAAAVPITKKARVDAGPPATDTPAFVPASALGVAGGISVLMQKHRLIAIGDAMHDAGTKPELLALLAQERFVGGAAFYRRQNLLVIRLWTYPPEPLDRNGFALRILADLQKHGLADDRAYLELPPSRPADIYIGLHPAPVAVDAAVVPEDKDL